MAELECRITDRAPEKRQRILISSRYDEAMANVDRSLREVSHALQRLLQNGQHSPKQSKGAAGVSADTRTPLSSTSNVSQEGYTGDSSFRAHVKRVTTAMAGKAADLGLDTAASVSPAATPQAAQMIRQVAECEDGAPVGNAVSLFSFQVRYPELGSRQLPPVESVLKILQLCHTQKQGFFIDVPIFDEWEFGEMCQKVYFPIHDYSISTWAIVNTGLFYLLHNLDERHYPTVGVTHSDVQAHLHLLSANVEATICSLRLCESPSVEGCRALALLVSNPIVPCSSVAR